MPVIYPVNRPATLTLLIVAAWIVFPAAPVLAKVTDRNTTIAATAVHYKVVFPKTTALPKPADKRWVWKPAYGTHQRAPAENRGAGRVVPRERFKVR